MDSDDVLHCNHNKLCTSVTTAYCFMFPPINTCQPPSLYRISSRGGGIFLPFYINRVKNFSASSKSTLLVNPEISVFFQEVKGFLLFNINRTKYFLVLHQMLTSSSKPWNISTQSIQHQYASLLSTCCCLLWSFVAKISLATSLAKLSLHKF